MTSSEVPTGVDISARDVMKRVLRRESRIITVGDSPADEGRDAKRVHQLRVSARRLRSELRGVRGVLRREPWRQLDAELKWLGTKLGQLRDLEVLTELFEGQAADEPALRATILTALERRAVRRRRDVRTALESPRYAALAHRLDHLARHPHLGSVGDVPALQLFTPPLWEAACRYLDVVGEPEERRDDQDLHRVRVASKKCRYTFEVATLFLGDRTRVVADGLEAIQEILGHVHDRVVAVAFLDTLELPEEVDLELRRSLRAQISVLRPQWTTHFDVVRDGLVDVFGGPEVPGSCAGLEE